MQKPKMLCAVLIVATLSIASTANEETKTETLSAQQNPDKNNSWKADCQIQVPGTITKVTVWVDTGGIRQGDNITLFRKGGADTDRLGAQTIGGLGSNPSTAYDRRDDGELFVFEKGKVDDTTFAHVLDALTKGFQADLGTGEKQTGVKNFEVVVYYSPSN